MESLIPSPLRRCKTSEHACISAQTVLRIETALAKASIDRTLRRDLKTFDHKMTRNAAIELA